MSVHFTSYVWKHSKAKGTTRLVLLSIADQANDSGEAWPSVLSISNRCGGMTDRTIQQAITSLVEMGELHRQLRSGKSTLYTVLTPAESSPPTPEKSSPPTPEGFVPPKSSRGEAEFVGGVKPASRRGEAGFTQNHQEPSEKHQQRANSTKSTNRGTRISVPFEVTEQMREWASKELPGFDTAQETENFVDYWLAAPGQKGVKLDWPATWRKWMRTTAARQRTFRPRNEAPPPSYDSRPAPAPEELPWGR